MWRRAKLLLLLERIRDLTATETKTCKSSYVPNKTWRFLCARKYVTAYIPVYCTWYALKNEWYPARVNCNRQLWAFFNTRRISEIRTSFFRISRDRIFSYPLVPIDPDKRVPTIMVTGRRIRRGGGFSRHSVLIRVCYTGNPATPPLSLNIFLRRVPRPGG